MQEAATIPGNSTVGPEDTEDLEQGGNKQEEGSQGTARAVGTFRVKGPPKLDDASLWPNYKKRLAIWKNMCKACDVSEMHMGSMDAMSMSDSCKQKTN